MKKRSIATAVLASGLALAALLTPNKSPQTRYISPSSPAESAKIEIPEGAIKRYHFNPRDTILKIDGKEYLARVHKNEVIVEGEKIPELYMVGNERGTPVSYVLPVESEDSLERTLREEYGQDVKIKFW